MQSHHKLVVLILGILVILSFGIMACGGETITIERSTEEPERPTPTDEPSSTRSLLSSGATATPSPTGEARGQALAPLLSDGKVLEAFYEATEGDSWYNNEGWLVTDDINEWYGVTADAAGQVTALELAGNNLSGELPEGLGDLENLEVLDLQQNQLSGSLPSGLAELSNLEQVYLNNNQFSGALPAGMGAITGLTDLWLHDNAFSGELPTELATLPDLDSATIWGNSFSFADSYAPGLLGDLVALVAFHDELGGENWGSNAGWLSGTSPGDWSGVTTGGGRVTELVFEGWGLSGDLPPQLGNLTELTRLVMPNNQLEGELPAALGNLTKLRELTLSYNQLDGDVPSELGNLTELQTLNLGVNAFSGEIPASLGSLTNLENLYLAENTLTGEIPAGLGGLSRLEVLSLRENQLSPNPPKGSGHSEEARDVRSRIEAARP